MFDLKKRMAFEFPPTVTEMKKALETLPGDMQIMFCGAPAGYLHVDESENICSFDYSDLADEYKVIIPKDLGMGDFVVLGDGNVYQIQPNRIAAETGLSLFGSTYSCLEHLDNYDDNFNCTTAKEFNIHKIVCLYGNDEDSYKTVGQHFIARMPMSKAVMECINWDWEREEEE